MTNLFGFTTKGSPPEDIPFGIGDYPNTIPMNDIMPPELIRQGYELLGFEPARRGKDPVVIRNRWKHIIYEWPEGFIPNYADVIQVCHKLNIF